MRKIIEPSSGNQHLMRSVIPCILLIAPFVQYWFFAICILLGVDYSESSGSEPYTYASLFLCVICIMSAITRIISSKESFRKPCWLCLCVVGLIAMSLLASLQQLQQYNYLGNFMVFGMIGLFSGLLLSSDEDIAKAVKVIDFVVIICFLGATLFELAQYSVAIWRTRGYAGLSYQTISYMSALAYSLNLWSLVFASQQHRVSALNHTIFKTIRIVLVPALLIVLALSGGRGGVLAAGAVTLAVAIILITSGRVSAKVGLGIIAMAIIALAAFLVWGDALLDYRGFERIVTRGDNRSDVWEMAIHAIEGAPIIGYGFGGYGEAFNGLYPHNIILDVTLSTGLLGLVLFVFACAYLISRVRLILNTNRAWGAFLAILGVFSIAYLSVSGTFISFAPFWFVVAAAISYKAPICANNVEPVGER